MNNNSSKNISEEVKLESDIFSKVFLVLDSETAPRKDLKPLQTEVIELGWCLVERGQITTYKSYLTKPMYQIPEYVSNSIGITNQMVHNASDILEVVPLLIGDIDQSTIIVGHNMKYDINCINESIYRRDPHFSEFTRIIENHILLDTMTLFSKLFPGERKRLKDLLNTLEIPIKENLHRAQADAYYTALSLLKMIQIFEDRYKMDNIESLLKYSKTGNPNIQKHLF